MKKEIAARLRGLGVFCGIILAWWIITLLGVPPYLLPTPAAVAKALVDQWGSLYPNALITLFEIVVGLLCGLALGAGLALCMVLSNTLQRWLMPVIVISQAIPVFAMAPLLVLWFGFGMTSKIVMCVLCIFFPVVAAFFDGLRHTEKGWLDLARTMGATNYAEMRHIRLIAALPAFGSGMRVAAAVAPIGAVIGEWVGSSGGLGYVMLNANARMQTATCFAALVILAVVATVLWKIVDRSLAKILYWVPDSHGM